MAAADEKAGRVATKHGEAGPVSPCRGCGCADRADGRGEEVPAWHEHVDPAGAARLDVRPMLAVGEPPFASIMQAADALSTGGVLTIQAPFDPQPLRRVLAGKGFSTYGERLGPGHWQIWCRRDAPGAEPCEGLGGDRPAHAADPGEDPRIWRSGDVVHIDVRGLQAPRPLVAILALIDGGAHDARIVVHHNRDPLYLYPELEDRGWQYQRLPGPEGEVRLDLRGPS